MRFIGINEMYGFFSYSEEELRKPKEAYDCSAIIESMTDKDSWNKPVSILESLPVEFLLDFGQKHDDFMSMESICREESDIRGGGQALKQEAGSRYLDEAMVKTGVFGKVVGEDSACDIESALNYGIESCKGLYYVLTSRLLPLIENVRTLMSFIETCNEHKDHCDRLVTLATDESSNIKLVDTWLYAYSESSELPLVRPNIGEVSKEMFATLCNQAGVFRGNLGLYKDGAVVVPFPIDASDEEIASTLLMAFINGFTGREYIEDLCMNEIELVRENGRFRVKERQYAERSLYKEVALIAACEPSITMK